MLSGLHVGFGDPVGVELLRELQRFGCQMVRISADKPVSQGPGRPPRFERQPADRVDALVGEVRDAGLMPLVIVRDPSQILEVPPDVPIEAGNEPDLSENGWSPESYRNFALACIPIADGRNPLFIGCPSNLHKRGFEVLNWLPWTRIPAWVGCTVHRYPNPDGGPMWCEMKHRSGPRAGRRFSREEEVSHVRTIVGERAFGVSEIGYTLVDFPLQRAAEHWAWERRFWEAQGAEFAIAYQLTDGPGQTTYDHYGFRRLDGAWKPALLQSWFGAQT